MRLIRWWKRRQAGRRLAVNASGTVVTWPALFFGECPLCGHEWLEGEVIGAVVTAYERDRHGVWYRSPATRVVDALCVDRHEREGDWTVEAAKREGVL